MPSWVLKAVSIVSQVVCCPLSQCVLMKTIWACYNQLDSTVCGVLHEPCCHFWGSQSETWLETNDSVCVHQGANSIRSRCWFGSVVAQHTYPHSMLLWIHRPPPFILGLFYEVLWMPGRHSRHTFWWSRCSIMAECCSIHQVSFYCYGVCRLFHLHQPPPPPSDTAPGLHYLLQLAKIKATRCNAWCF